MASAQAPVSGVFYPNGPAQRDAVLEARNRDEACRLNGLPPRQGAAVQDGHFPGGELDAGVEYRTGVEGRQQVFCRMYRRAAVG